MRRECGLVPGHSAATTNVLIPIQELEVSHTQQHAVSVADWQKLQAGEFTQAWTYASGEYEVEDIFDGVDLSCIHLIKTSVHQGPNILTTTSSLEPMGAFLDACEAARPKKEKAKGSSTSQQPPAKKRATTKLPSWMGVTPGTAAGQASSSSGSSTVPASSAAGLDEDAGDMEPVQLDEHALDTVWAELEDARTAQATQQATLEDCFCEHLLGGAWQVQRTGRVVYGVQSVIKPNTVVEACAKKFGLTKSAAFEYNVYGENFAMAFRHGFIVTLEIEAVLFGGSLERLWPACFFPIFNFAGVRHSC